MGHGSKRRDAIMQSYKDFEIYQIANKTQDARHKTHDAKGVTLIELVMVMVVVGILAGGLSLGIREATDLYQFLTFRNEIVSQGRMALMRMVREIRQMPSRDPTFEPIQVADSNRLRFTAIDLDGDGNDDTIEFYRDAGNNELRRIFNGPFPGGDILASDVVNLNFCYYDKGKNPVCTPVCSCTVSSAQLPNIDIIEIHLQIQSGSQSITLRSQVYPRNL